VAIRQLRAWILDHLVRNEPFVLAAVTMAQGSTARGTDALMAMDMRGENRRHSGRRLCRKSNDYSDQCTFQE